MILIFAHHLINALYMNLYQVCENIFYGYAPFNFQLCSLSDLIYISRAA